MVFLQLILFLLVSVVYAQGQFPPRGRPPPRGFPPPGGHPPHRGHPPPHRGRGHPPPRRGNTFGSRNQGSASERRRPFTNSGGRGFGGNSNNSGRIRGQGGGREGTGFPGGFGGGGGGRGFERAETIRIQGSRSGRIRTIVGCNDPSNRNQPGRSVEPSISCQRLRRKARAIARGQADCNHSGGRGMGPPPTSFGGCKREGATYTVQRMGPPGKKRRRKRQFGSGRRGGQRRGFGGPGGRGCAWKQGYNIKSVYIEEIIGDWRVIATNGIPNHAYDQKTPNRPCETYRIMLINQGTAKKIPRGSPVQTPMGAIGIAKSGAFLFNHMSAEPTCRVAAIAERESFGSCFGHSQQEGFWHYHAPSRCLTRSAVRRKDSSDTHRCPIIGYLLDGYPVRDACRSYAKSCYSVKPSKKLSCQVRIIGGPPGGRNQKVWPGCDVDDYFYDSNKKSNGDCTLDEASGRKTGRSRYSYFLTDDTDPRKAYPYIVSRWHYNNNRGGKEGYMCALNSQTDL